jgi:peroxiredoxin
MRYLIVLFLLLGTANSQSVPDLALKDTLGATHNLSEFRGKVVLLNFWATWCIPCKQEMPIFVDAEKRYRDRGLIVLAASVDDSKTKKYIAKFAHAQKMNFPILVDANPEMMKQLGLNDTIPSTIFLDDQGNIAGKIVGQAKKKDVLQRLDKLLAKK